MGYLMTFEAEITVFRPHRPGIRKVLGDLEAEIMELIWALPAGQGTSVRDVFEALYGQRRIAYTTVMTTMMRLAKKQLLRIEKKEQTYIYIPTVTEQEFISRLVSLILEDLLISFSDATLEGLNSFPDQEASSRARQYLAEIMRRRQQEED
jgi:predicted transcriptional regulator